MKKLIIISALVLASPVIGVIIWAAGMTTYDMVAHPAEFEARFQARRAQEKIEQEAQQAAEARAAANAPPAAFPDPRTGFFGGMDPEVCVAPQLEVEDRLKSGSGSFEICRIRTVSADHKRVVIIGRVTSTNSFNAKVRTGYTAELIKKANAKPGDRGWDTWLVTSLEFD